MQILDGQLVLPQPDDEPVGLPLDRIDPRHPADVGRVPGVDSVERQTDRLVIRLREDELAVEDLHGELVRLGAKIRMYQPEAMDMETAFMKLTEGVTA